MFQPQLRLSTMWRQRRSRRWSLAAVAESNPLAAIRGRLGPRRKTVEGLCVSSLQGALRWHTWLMEEQQEEQQQHQPAHFLSVSVRPADGEDLELDLDLHPALPALDLQLSHLGQGRRSLRPLSSSLAERLSLAPPPEYPDITK